MRQPQRTILNTFCLIFIIVMYNVSLCDDCFAFALHLSPTSFDQLEMSSVTLKCSTEVRMTTVKWIRNTLEAAIELYSGTCKTYPGNFLTENPNLYSCSCTETDFTLTLNNISRLNHNDVWKCSIPDGNRFIDSNSITIRIKVPLTTLSLGPYNSQITEKENTNISLRCTTSVCRPKPMFLWYKDKTKTTEGDEILLSGTPIDDVSGSQIQSYINTYSIELTRELNGWYLFCAADNQNNSFVLSNKIFLNVTYPPDGPISISNLGNKSEFRVLQNDFVRLECSITGGNPLPRLEWDKYNESPQQINGNTVTKTTSWQVTGRDPEDLICRFFHIYKNNSVHITINILYPPDKPEISIETSSGIYLNVDKTISVIEGQTIKLNCSAKSNPPVSLFKWNNLRTELGNVFTSRVDRHTQSISCYVSNEMQFSDSRVFMTGYNIISLDVDVLYPPTVNKMPNRTVYEGDDVIYRCNFEPGNPHVTNVTWSWNGTTWNDLQLTISNVSMHQAGIYRCDVRNFMVSLDGNIAFGNTSGEFYLSVQHVQSENNDDTSPTSSNVNVVAASASVTVAGVVFFAASIIILTVYKRRKRLSYQKKEMSIQYYNCSDSKLNETISTKADNANTYEAFHQTGLVNLCCTCSDRQYDSLSPEDCKTEKKNDCQISAEGGNLHVYEGLQTKGFDQQYETISQSTCNVKIEQHKIYENLQL